MCAHIFRYAQYNHTTLHTHKYAHTKTCTKHIHRQAYSSPAFCIGDTFHYSKLLSGDVVCTSRGDMHSLQTRYTLIMHAQTTGIAFWCACVCVCAYVLCCAILPNCKALYVGHMYVSCVWTSSVYLCVSLYSYLNVDSWHFSVYTCTYSIQHLYGCPCRSMAANVHLW